MPPHVNFESMFEGPRIFRRAEIAKSASWRDEKEKTGNKRSNNSTAPWYIIVDNKVYDIREFVSDHPGGAVILTHIGKDATDAFNVFHPENVNEILADYYVGDVASEDIITSKEGFIQELREIKQQFKDKNYFKSSKLYYSLKIASNVAIWMTSVLILANYGNAFFGVMLSAATMGLFWQQSGWLSHDFLHHQVFEQRRWGNFMGAFLGGVCQGFSPSWWKDKHNTHHAAPNVHGQDPDIATHPILTWSEYALSDLFESGTNENLPQPDGLSLFIRFMIQHQSLFYFPLLSIARISWCIQSIIFVLPHGQDGKPAKARIHISTIEPLSLAIHYAWYTSIMYLYIKNSLVFYFTFIFVSQATCGLLLALVFSLNHNGMKVLTEEESQEMDFFVEQVVTGRDVISCNPSYQWWINWFCGGLNYQIEHHLFPSMPRHNFHKIQPVIQNLCEKHKVPYHRTTFWEGTLEVFDRLGQVSAASKKFSSNY